jgi:hypothetical protein
MGVAISSRVDSLGNRGGPVVMTPEDSYALIVVTVINFILAMLTYGHVAEMRHMLRSIGESQSKTQADGEGQS